MTTVTSKPNPYLVDRGTTQIAVFNAVVSTVQDYWREFRAFPDAKSVLERMPVGSTHPSVCRIMASPGFEQSMEMRGIPLRDSRGLSPQQSVMVSVMTNPADRRTMSAKLKSVGISHNTYANWLKNPLFKNAVNRQAEDLLDVHTGDVLTQLTAKATSGDLNAIKFYLEVNGRHDPSRRENVDVRALMAQILEIISRRVKDSETLGLIASDFALLGGAEAALMAPRAEVIQSGVVVEPLPDVAQPLPEAISESRSTPEESALAWLQMNNPLSGGEKMFDEIEEF